MNRTESSKELMASQRQFRIGYSRRSVHWKHVQKFPDREAAAHAMKTLELQNPELCYRVVKA